MVLNRCNSCPQVTLVICGDSFLLQLRRESLLLVFCGELSGVLLYILEYSGQYSYKKLCVMQNIDRGQGEEPGLDLYL